ncbi:MAG: hypothetical protein U0169_04580 [Polyangiaceae bacterium]
MDSRRSTCLVLLASVVVTIAVSCGQGSSGASPESKDAGADALVFDDVCPAGACAPCGTSADCPSGTVCAAVRSGELTENRCVPDGGTADASTVDAGIPGVDAATFDASRGNDGGGRDAAGQTGTLADAATDAADGSGGIVCSDPSVIPTTTVVRYVRTVATAPSSATNLSVFGNRLYAPDPDASGGTLFDLTDPASPTVVGALPSPVQAARDVFVVSRDEVIFGNNYQGLAIVDFTNESAPVLRGQVAWSMSQLYGVVARGSRVYAANAPGLGSPDDFAIVDVSSKTSPALLRTYDDPASPNGDGGDRATGLALSGNTVYLNYTSSNMAILDVTNDVITRVGTIAMPPHTLGLSCVGRVQTPLVVGSTLFVPRCAQGYFAYSIANPTAPTLLGTTYEPACRVEPRAFDMRGTTAVVVAGSHVRVYDMTNPTRPALRGHIDLFPHQGSLGLQDVALSEDGHHAYVSLVRDGIAVLEIL